MEAFFVPAASGQRLLVHHPAQGSPRGGVVHVQPYAEEMNKSRRMATLQAQTLASKGWTVAMPDLAGCGDSSGEFAEATWDAWIDDVLLAVQWLRARTPGPVWLWGLRMGALLAAAAARRDPTLRRLLLWQPPAAGRTLLQQFLRLRMASSLEQGTHRGAVEAVRSELASGRTVEIAGYELSPVLAQGLEAATLEPPPGPGLLLWREVAADPSIGLLPAGQATRGQWAAAGWRVDADVRHGPAYWQTTEIETAPAMIETDLPDDAPGAG